MDDRMETPPDVDSLDAALRAVAHAPPVDPGTGFLAAGTLIGESFRIEEPIGAGGMGVVYRAWDVRLQRKVAIKLHAAGSDGGLYRLVREARALARLAHPNVITVHEVGTVGDRVFIAMEYIDGVDASAWLTEQPRSLQEILDLFINAAHGLVAAHAAGLIHRDFKPSNVLVGHDGRVLVADFGLARHVEETAAVLETGDVSGPRGEAVTAAGSVLGTPAYMSPEQREGGTVDARADQYAFCVALHEAVHGTLPSLEGAALDERPRRPRQKVPRWLHAILQRGLERDRENRFASMEDLLARLQTDPNRTRRRIALGVGTGLALGATAWATHAATLPTACHDTGRSIEETWNPAVATALREALRDTGSPLAEAASSRIVPALDAYASRWSAQRREACEATRIRGEQSEAMLDRGYACLDRRRRELVAVVGVLRSADAALVEHAVDTLGALGSIDACAEKELFESDVAPPDDPATRRAVDEVGAAIARVDAENRAGRAREVRSQAESALERARELAHRPLLVDAWLTMAAVHHELGEFQASIDASVVAHREAVAAGLPRQAWRSAVRVGADVGRVTSGTAEALRWLDAAEGWAERSSLTVSDRSLARRTRASILHHAGRFEAAAAELEAVLAELEGAPEAEHDLERASVLTELGMVLKELPRLDEAHAATVEGLERMEAVLGEGHPEVANALGILSHIEILRQRTELAVAAAERALAITRERRGDASVATASERVTYANALSHAGRRSEAIAELQRALEVLEALDPPAPEKMVIANLNLARVLAETGAHEQAIDRMHGALELERAAFGTDTLRTAELRLSLGGLLIQTERYEESVEESLAALPLLERHLGENNARLGHARLNLAVALAELGRFAEAHRSIDRAEASMSTASEPSWAAEVLLRRADVLEMEGRLAEALDAFHAVTEFYERVLEPDAHELAFARLRHGRLLIETGELEAAIAPLRLAVATAERIELSPGFLGSAQLSLAKALWADRASRNEARAIIESAIAVLAEAEPEEAAAARRWLEKHR